MNLRTWVVGLVVLSAAGKAGAEAPLTKPLRSNLAVDVPVTLGAGVVWAGAQIFKEELAADACRWCAVTGLDSSARDSVRWSNTGRASTLGDVGVYGFMPLATFGVATFAAYHDDDIFSIPVNTLVIAEAVAVAGALNQIFKLSFARERPFVHALPVSGKGNTSQPEDNNTSFYSGHTSFAFSLAVASGTVASLKGYRLAPVIWGVGLAGAAASGYLAMAADRHYLTDVAVGAVAGSAIGFAVPYFLHRAHAPARSVPDSVVAMPTKDGAMIAAAWRW